MTPTERFVRLAAGPEEELQLDVAALLLAGHAHPELRVEDGLAELDALAQGIPSGDLDALRHKLFDEAGFRGNSEDYYDPENSYLDTVLQRRCGIPITLSVVVLEVGRRAGVALTGVGMPGHFLVGTVAEPPRYVDAFAGGAVLDAAACAARFHQLSGGRTLEPSALAPVGPRAILARMLANLTGIARQRRDLDLLRWVLELRAAIPSRSPAERRDLAAALAGSGRFDEAAHVLEELAGAAGAAEAAKLQEAARALRARLN
jgi:regulator of sirC expression with transglutaminase-like and TPR domain